MATLTITTTAQQDARLQKAYAAVNGWPRDATLQEVRTLIIQQIIDTVRKGEQIIADQAVAPIDIT